MSLLTCEDRVPSLAYGRRLVALGVGSRAAFVVSDLHLAAGLGADGAFQGLENFFADDAFFRMVTHLIETAGGSGPTLVINGDFIDFFRVTSVPDSAEELEQWQAALRSVGDEASLGDLEASVTDKDRVYGLGAEERESVYKVMRVVEGHARFFDGLARLLEAGGRLVLVKGNHDLDLYWPKVRAFLRLALARRLDGAPNEGSSPSAIARVCPPWVVFVDHAVVLNDEVYLEHGHRFDPFSCVRGDPTLPGGTEINLPFGSFFNRYLLNRIESSFPFIDNVRPREAVLPLLIRQRFPLALRLLAFHLPFALRVIPKRYYRYVLGRALVFFAVLCVALGLFVWQAWSALAPAFSAVAGLRASALWATALDAGASLLWLVMGFALSQVVAHFQLGEPTHLATFGLRELSANPRYRAVVYGHTHHPDIVHERGRWALNTGTWMPMVELSSAAVRHDRTYAVVVINFDGEGHVEGASLRRWNDDAGRFDAFAPMRRARG